MSFFKKAVGGIKERFSWDWETIRPWVFGPAAGGTKEETLGTLRGIRNVLDPRSWKFIANLRDRSPYAPPDPWKQDLTKIRTPEQAREALDDLLGVDASARREAEAIYRMREGGKLARFVTVLQEHGFTGEYGGLPFTGDGDARLATGNFPQDPAIIIDQKLFNKLQGDERLATEYLRLSDPLSLMPALTAVQRDMGYLGNEKDNNFLDLLGRPFAAAKDIGVGLLNMEFVERIEQLIGEGYYMNTVPDPYMREVMAKRAYDFNMFEFWDMDHEHERLALEESERLMAIEGLTSEERALQFELFLKENSLGAAGWFSDLAGKVIADPLWVFGSVVKIGVGIPLKIAGVELPRAGAVGRLVTPTGRAIAFDNKGIKELFKLKGLRTLVSMPEVSYKARQLLHPKKGITRLLTERTANLQAKAVERKLGLVLHDDVIRQVVRDPNRIDDISRAFLKGEHTDWTREQIPLLFQDAEIAWLSAVAKRDQRLIWDKAKSNIVDTMDSLAEKGKWRPELTQAEAMAARAAGEAVLPPDTLRAMIGMRLVEDAARVAAEAQEALWKESAAGRFMVKWLFPTSAKIRAGTALVALNTFGFLHLNVIANSIRLMWDAGLHPLRGANALARSLWTESATIAKGGGTEPEAWARGLKAIGITPLQRELYVTSITSRADLLGDSARTILKMGDTTNLEDDAFEVLERAMLHPAKEVGSHSRWSDKMMGFVYMASRDDKASRRAFFMSNLWNQIDMGTAPGGGYHNLFRPMRTFLRDEKGLTDDVINKIENAFADEVQATAQGVKALPAGAESLNEGALVSILEEKIGHMISGDARGVISAHEIAQDFVKGRGLIDPKGIPFAMLDTKEFRSWATTDLIPKVAAAQKAGTLDDLQKILPGIVRDKASEYDIPADIVRGLNRSKKVMRSPNSFVRALSVTPEIMIDDMRDQISHLNRLMNVAHPTTWANNRPVVWQEVKQFRELAHAATTGNMQHLEKITGLFRALRQQGVEKISGSTVIPRELAEEWLRVPSEFTVAQLWNSYFKVSDDSWNVLYKWIADSVGKKSLPHKAITEELAKIRVGLRATHRKYIDEALAEGTAEAWTVAGEKVRLSYETAASRRGGVANWGPNDPPKPIQFQDANAVLAQEMQEFGEHFITSIQQKIEGLKAGTLRFEAVEIEHFRDAASTVQKAWPEMRDTMLANTRLATDFGMLDYTAQFGIDRVIQMIVPFEFWPTRDAVNWAIRGARNPGAFGALMIMMFGTEDIAEQYGYPQRLQNRFPIPLPGLDDFLERMPGLGGLIEDGDFSPVYFVDTMRYVYPYTYLRDNYDDERRRNTVAGRILDFAQTMTPLNVGPFQTFVGRQIGLLDKDAWRTTYLSGGPFGIPTTVLARKTAEFVFNGNTDAIPEEEQALYLERGHFSLDWLNNLLGLGKDEGAVWRAERALASLVATGELVPGAPKEEQITKAMIAADSHRGPEWKKAVKASRAEENLRRMTAWLGFPFGDLIAVNEGEMIWFGLKGMYSEYARQGRIAEFFEKYPEFKVRSATVRGLSDPEEREKAIDTELYYTSLEDYVYKPFESTVVEIENERHRLRGMEQSQAVRDQLKLLDDELGQIREVQSTRRDELDRAFPYRAAELSLNQSPRERALRQVRTAWFDIDRGDEEEYDVWIQRREDFLGQFPAVENDAEHELELWDLEKQSILVKLEANRARNLAFADNDFDKAREFAADRDGQLEQIHAQAEQLITRKDVETYLGSFSEPPTPQQREFEFADATHDLWFSLLAGPFTSREKAAISAYFRSLPEIQKFYPLDAVDLDALTLEQRLAIMTRKEFWRTYNSIRDINTQRDFLRAKKPEVDAANRLLGLPPLEILDIDPFPPEASGDPLFDHIRMMSALNRRRELEADESLTAEERRELEQLIAMLGDDPEDVALTAEDVDRYLNPYSMPDSAVGGD